MLQILRLAFKITSEQVKYWNPFSSLFSKTINSTQKKMAEYVELFLYFLKFKQMYIEFYICLNLLCCVYHWISFFSPCNAVSRRLKASDFDSNWRFRLNIYKWIISLGQVNSFCMWCKRLFMMLIGVFCSSYNSNVDYESKHWSFAIVLKQRAYDMTTDHCAFDWWSALSRKSTGREVEEFYMCVSVQINVQKWIIA